MGIPSRQEIGLRPANLWLVPKFQTGHVEERGPPSHLWVVRAPPCTNRRYASPRFYPPAERLGRAREMASSKYFERPQEVKTSPRQVPSWGPRSALAYRKSFSSYETQLWIDARRCWA